MLVFSLLSREIKAQEIISPADSCISDTASSVMYSLSPISAHISNINWSTAGDIAIVGVDTGYFVTIKSRPAIPGGTGDGKGRLYASYANDSFPDICGPRLIYKDLYKYFDDSDNIVGPHCVSNGDTVTYSISPRVSVNLDAEIGIDRYKWIIPSSWTSNILYYSADSSSITFKVGTTTGHDSLIVGVGQCNFDDGNYTDTLVLGLQIPPPILSYPSCLPADSKTVTVKWTNPPVGIPFTYSWIKPTTWGIISSSQDSIVLSVNDTNPGTVTLVVNDTCQVVDSSAYINRSLGSNSTISGLTCVAAGSQQSYTATNIPVNTPLQWTIPTNRGWSFATTDTTAQTILVNVGTVSADTIFVSAISCNSVVDTLVVNLQPGNPTTLTGDTCIAAGYTDSLTYTVNHVSNTTGYGWIFPSGWSPASTTTSDTLVKVKPNGVTGGLVQVYAQGCANSDTISLNVNFGPTQPDSIVAPACISSGIADTVNFSVYNVVGGQTYNWIIPPTWSILSAGTDSTSISVITDGVNGTYYVKARGINSCDSTAYDSVKVVVNGLSFSVDVTDYGGGYVAFSLTPSPVSGATYYTWYFNGAYNSSGSGATVMFINGGAPSSGTGCVYIQNDSGCITYQCASYGTEGRSALSTAKSSAIDDNAVSVYPNPAQNTLTVKFAETGNNTISLIDDKGSRLLKTTSVNSSEVLDVSNIPAGSYILLVQSQDGQVIPKKVQIIK
jgi:hypothetical protein